MKTSKTIAATEFKAKCLAVLDEVQATGEPIIIYKRGKPVARLVPVATIETTFPQHSLKGTVSIEGDIVGPVLPEQAWDVLIRDSRYRRCA